MVTPMMGNRLPDDDRPWAADTGCFAAPEKYDAAVYLRWLYDRRDHAHRCLFATAPDVVGDARATLRKAAVMLPLIRHLGYKAAFVAQDGLENLAIPWDDFDALFIGGTTQWKLSEAAYDLVHAANQNGKWTHQGRCNSLRRLRAAQAAGYDSADGTFLAFGPDKNLPRLNRWLTTIRQQPALL